MKTLDMNKVHAAAEKYYTLVKNENLLADHDMIIFTNEYQFRLANQSMVKLSERLGKDILAAYRIDSLGNLFYV